MVAQLAKPINLSAENGGEQSGEIPARYSSEDYLELEVLSDIRNEFRDGEIVPMTGGLPNHNQISGNIYATMNVALRRKPYQVFIADQRLWIPDHRLHTYPDVMVLQGELQFKEGRKDTLINPLLIVEVLSKSTQDYDRGDKFAAYRSIPSFQEYLLVDQYTQHIEHYLKTGERTWKFTEYSADDGMFHLVSIDLEMAIDDIYDKVVMTIDKAGQ